MSDFHVTRHGPAWDEALGGQLRDPEALLARGDTRMLKHRDAGRTVGLVALGGAGWVVKLYEEHGLVDWFERLAFGSPAARAAEGIERMRRAGFETPELVAVLETPPGAASRSVLVTRAIADGDRADEAWEHLGAADRLRFAAELGSYVRDLHGRGVYPQDLWMTNLLVVATDDRWRWILVDLDRVRVYRRLTWKRRLKNLVQIERSLGRAAADEERARFLQAYLGPVSGEELRRIGAQIIDAGRRKDLQHGDAGR
jgi:tRNA A-37 threonylcarbamoyl transferase component Bud32